MPLRDEKIILSEAVMAVTSRTPLIASAVVRAKSGAFPSRREQLRAAIRHTRELLDKLQDAQRELGWKERDVA